MTFGREPELTAKEQRTLWAALEQAQARMAKMRDALKAVLIGLEEPHQRAGMDCGEAPCTLCWLLGEAKAALAEEE